MLSADGHLTHHLPASITVSIPIRKYVDVVVAGVSPAEPHGVHPVVREVANAEELVDVRLISANFIAT
jgi:hypothetical protein